MTSEKTQSVDATVLGVVKQYPDRRLRFIRYLCGMKAVECQTALRRLTRQGKLKREYHSRGYFQYYTYRVNE